MVFLWQARYAQVCYDPDGLGKAGGVRCVQVSSGCRWRGEFWFGWKGVSMDDKIKAMQVVNDYIRFDRASSNVTQAWETVLRYIKSLEKSVK